MKQMLIVTLLGLAGCTGAYQSEPTPYLSAAEVDRGCILTAGDKLGSLTGRDATDGRIVPMPAGAAIQDPGAADQRAVALNALNSGIQATYTFLCVRSVSGRFYAYPLGRS